MIDKPTKREWERWLAHIQVSKESVHYLGTDLCGAVMKEIKRVFVKFRGTRVCLSCDKEVTKEGRVVTREALERAIARAVCRPWQDVDCVVDRIMGYLEDDNV